MPHSSTGILYEPRLVTASTIISASPCAFTIWLMALQVVEDARRGFAVRDDDGFNFLSLSASELLVNVVGVERFAPFGADDLHV